MSNSTPCKNCMPKENGTIKVVGDMRHPKCSDCGKEIGVPEASKTKVREILGSVEFLHGVPVKAPEETINKIVELIDKAVADARKEVIEKVEALLCTHNYSSMNLKDVFNIKEEIRYILATLKEEAL